MDEYYKVAITRMGSNIRAACSPSLSSNGLINYGTIDAAQLLANPPTVLEEKMLSFTVS